MSSDVDKSGWWRCMFGNNLVSSNQAESAWQSNQPHPSLSLDHPSSPTPSSPPSQPHHIQYYPSNTMMTMMMVMMILMMMMTILVILKCFAAPSPLFLHQLTSSRSFGIAIVISILVVIIAIVISTIVIHTFLKRVSRPQWSRKRKYELSANLSKNATQWPKNGPKWPKYDPKWPKNDPKWFKIAQKWP